MQRLWCIGKRLSETCAQASDEAFSLRIMHVREIKKARSVLLLVKGALVPLRNSARSQVACKTPQWYQRRSFSAGGILSLRANTFSLQPPQCAPCVSGSEQLRASAVAARHFFPEFNTHSRATHSARLSCFYTRACRFWQLSSPHARRFPRARVSLCGLLL